MHQIQQHILGKLITAPSQRFSELKPDQVESNLFMYHLKQLIDQGYVSKIKDGSYSLTAYGLQYADGLSLKTFAPRLQPRIVTLSVVTDNPGRYLLFRRHRQPLINMVGFPYGKVHLDETITEAATRELKEKTGLECALKHRGDGYLTMSQNGEVVSQVLFHCFEGLHPQGELKQTSVGEAFWADPSQIPGWELMPSVMDIIDQLQQPGHFFMERSYTLEAASSLA
jgi:ADP-ribose pyrophosphatase YjhB (NUDIX family)